MTTVRQLKPRGKITQRVTRGRLIEENQTTGDVESVSEREAEQTFHSMPPRSRSSNPTPQRRSLRRFPVRNAS